MSDAPKVLAPKVLAFSGSARKDSLNTKLVQVAADAAEAAGAAVTRINLRDFPMPVFDGDLEAADGLPESAVKMKALLADHDAFLIASPEYNSSIAPLLKNTIDWSSRSHEGKPGLGWAHGKVAALISASPGGLGGLRALAHVRSILQNIGIMVIPRQKTLPGAGKMFDENGGLIDDKQREGVEAVARDLVETARKMTATR